MEIRRIKSREEIERAEKIKGRWITGVLLFLLLASTAGFAFTSGDRNSGQTSNTDQTQVNGKYAITFGSTTLYFSSSIQQVKNISVNMTSNLNSYYGRTLYLDSNNSFVTNEIGTTLGNYVSLRLACYGKCDQDLPEKTCNDSIIVYRTSSVDRVYESGNCTFVDGDIRAVDAFLLKTFGTY